jgi:hypothetical protein
LLSHFFLKSFYYCFKKTNVLIITINMNSGKEEEHTNRHSMHRYVLLKNHSKLKTK